MSFDVTMLTIVTVLILVLFIILVVVLAFALLRRARQVDGYHWLAIAFSIFVSAIFLPQSYERFVWWIGECCRRILLFFSGPIESAMNCADADCAKYTIGHYLYGLSNIAPSTSEGPGGNVVPGILLALLFYAIFVATRAKINGGKISLDGAIISALFGTTILFSFYLCLTALLTIPLMQKETVQAGFSVEDLATSLTNSMSSRADFDARFPPIVLEDSGKTGEMSFVRSEIEKTNSMRTAIYQRLLDNKSQAIELFRAESAVGLGARESVVHFSELVRWFIGQRSSLEIALDACLTRARRAEFVLQTAVRGQVASSDTTTPQMEEVLLSLSTCSDIVSDSTSLPARRSRADALPIVGNWSGWLIRSESMPLTIIVGLVGFSFLGASLSRIIRTNKASNVVWLSVSDLLMVTISGASAALAVFVASYGGLAVVSQSTESTDPNPYIVFILCLAAAIYSEDVWAWLRTRFLQQINGEAEEKVEAKGADATPPLGVPATPDPK